MNEWIKNHAHQKKKMCKTYTHSHTSLHYFGVEAHKQNRHMSNHTRACFVLNLCTPQTLIISDE